MTCWRLLPAEERFRLSYRIDVNGPLCKGEHCWIWTRHCNKNKTRPTISVDSVQLLAHRFSYEQFIREIPRGMSVCHHCDNTFCVNPNHLFIGTQTDNMRDMKTKGRANKPTGENNGRANLTNADVEFIRRNYKFRSKRYGQKQLAQKFGVCTLTIQEVLNGKKWKHLLA